MGRGKNWEIDENATLARAWIAASVDPVAGVDQTRKVFMDTVKRRFIEFGPDVSKETEGRYGTRTDPSIRQHFSDMSADVQSFRVAMYRVTNSNPTGVVAGNIESMAVAIHLGKTNVMYYHYKDLPPTQWLYYKAWKVLLAHPKWSDVPEANETGGLEQESENNHADTAGSGSPEGESPQKTASNSTQSSGERMKVDRFPIGARGAKLITQEELRTQAVRTLAESAKRKSDILEEKNAISVFSRPEAQGLPETDEFFDAIRRTYLAKAQKNAKLAETEALALGRISYGSTENDQPATETQRTPPSAPPQNGPMAQNAS